MMDWLIWAWDVFRHLDDHLAQLLRDYGAWTYAILFAIVFIETGLVIWPFLPGDSLLFAAGALCVKGGLNLWWLMLGLWVAAVLGDAVNYHIGKWLGPHVFTERHRRFFKREHLDRTHRFYEKYGGKTIILARFVPVVRTFAPFVAGIGRMGYLKFAAYNVIGGALWVVSMVMAGYLFAETRMVKENFELVVIGIVVVSCLPGVWEFWRHRAEIRGTEGQRTRRPEDQQTSGVDDR